MNKENELEAYTGQSEREKAPLKAKPQQDGEPELEQQTRDILEYFFATGRAFTTEEIASHFEVPKSVAKQHLHLLVIKGHVSIRPDLAGGHSPGDSTGFIITALGKAYLVSVGAQEPCSGRRTLPLGFLG